MKHLHYVRGIMFFAIVLDCLRTYIPSYRQINVFLELFCYNGVLMFILCVLSIYYVNNVNFLLTPTVTIVAGEEPYTMMLFDTAGQVSQYFATQKNNYEINIDFLNYSHMSLQG